MMDHRPAMLRRLTGIIALLLVAWAPDHACAQARLGILVQEMGRAQSQAIKGLGEELKRLGYQEKKNLFFEVRNVKGNRAALGPAASELLARKVSVIFTTGTSATRAAMATTQDVPIVFCHPSDPIASGLVKNNGERAKNLTGVAAYATQTTEKRLQLFKEIYPQLRKVIVFFDANNAFSRDQFAVVEASAKKLGWQVTGYGIKSTDELKTTLGSVRGENGDAIFQISDDLFESENEFVFEMARQKKLPTMFNQEAWAVEGAMAAYGPNYLEMGRFAARLIDKIFKGEKPDALPIERAPKFDLTLNYRTATFIGFKFPPEILKKADKVIR
ncbi:MAG TPA: ABC transporter substrate-binding protein [Candidatus Binatia bacterium]|nr:ABC transporter substrate-binding protein [Candidatus Binatia bacterium]